MAHFAIAALDNAIQASGRGEWVILRRIVGLSPNVVNNDVRCFVQVDAVSVQQIVAGMAQTDLNIIMSTTQIDAAQWPGGSAPQVPPFDVDQRVPRITNDKMIVQGKLRTAAYVKPFFGGAGGKEILRLELRVTG